VPLVVLHQLPGDRGELLPSAGPQVSPGTGVQADDPDDGDAGLHAPVGEPPTDGGEDDDERDRVGTDGVEGLQPQPHQPDCGPEPQQSSDDALDGLPPPLPHRCLPRSSPTGEDDPPGAAGVGGYPKISAIPGSCLR
jgi:hypothetical protein